jgi:hypothetical protein
VFKWHCSNEAGSLKETPAAAFGHLHAWIMGLVCFFMWVFWTPPPFMEAYLLSEQELSGGQNSYQW